MVERGRRARRGAPPLPPARPLASGLKGSGAYVRVALSLLYLSLMLAISAAPSIALVALLPLASRASASLRTGDRALCHSSCIHHVASRIHSKFLVSPGAFFLQSASFSSRNLQVSKFSVPPRGLGFSFACSRCAAFAVRAVYVTVLVWFAVRRPTRHTWNSVFEVSHFYRSVVSSALPASVLLPPNE